MVNMELIQTCSGWQWCCCVKHLFGATCRFALCGFETRVECHLLGLSRGLAAARDNDYACLSQPRMRLTVLHGEGVASRLPTWRAAGLTQWTVSAV